MSRREEKRERRKTKERNWSQSASSTMFWTPWIVFAKIGLRSMESNVRLTISTTLSNRTANLTSASTPKRNHFVWKAEETRDRTLPRIFSWTLEMPTETPAVKVSNEATLASRFNRAWMLLTYNSIDGTETVACNQTSGGSVILNGKSAVQIDAVPVQLSVDDSW